jgi:hypothetical protein
MVNLYKDSEGITVGNIGGLGGTKIKVHEGESHLRGTGSLHQTNAFIHL